VQYFTPTGRFLGKWGSKGTGDGEFDRPGGIAVNADRRVYVADTWNARIQYFDEVPVSIKPSSLGKVKAIYK
jgi:DNA-binding beta-propeller fold protein YncE